MKSIYRLILVLVATLAVNPVSTTSMLAVPALKDAEKTPLPSREELTKFENTPLPQYTVIECDKNDTPNELVQLVHSVATEYGEKNPEYIYVVDVKESLPRENADTIPLVLATAASSSLDRHNLYIPAQLLEYSSETIRKALCSWPVNRIWQKNWVFNLTTPQEGVFDDFQAIKFNIASVPAKPNETGGTNSSIKPLLDECKRTGKKSTSELTTSPSLLSRADDYLQIYSGFVNGSPELRRALRKIPDSVFAALPSKKANFDLHIEFFTEAKNRYLQDCAALSAALNKPQVEYDAVPCEDKDHPSLLAELVRKAAAATGMKTPHSVYVVTTHKSSDGTLPLMTAPYNSIDTYDLFISKELLEYSQETVSEALAQVLKTNKRLYRKKPIVSKAALLGGGLLLGSTILRNTNKRYNKLEEENLIIPGAISLASGLSAVGPTTWDAQRSRIQLETDELIVTRFTPEKTGRETTATTYYQKHGQAGLQAGYHNDARVFDYLTLFRIYTQSGVLMREEIESTQAYVLAKDGSELGKAKALIHKTFMITALKSLKASSRKKVLLAAALYASGVLATGYGLGDAAYSREEGIKRFNKSDNSHLSEKGIAKIQQELANGERHMYHPRISRQAGKILGGALLAGGLALFADNFEHAI